MEEATENTAMEGTTDNADTEESQAGPPDETQAEAEAEDESEAEANAEESGESEDAQDPGSDSEEQEEPAEEDMQESENSEGSEEPEEPEEPEESENSDDLSDTAAALAKEDITLVDENSETVDMASQESLETISGADPWWLVGRTKYAFVKTPSACPEGTTLDNTCFVSSTPISEALTYMDANNLVPSNGILYVEADSYTEDITVDGSNGNGYLAKLKGIVSEGTSSDTTITGNVSVSNTTRGFKLSGFSITGSLSFDGNIGTITLKDVVVESSGGDGISITNHNGAVKVEQVRADNNTASGMVIDNTAGGSKTSVTITNSQFHNNGNIGLYINTNSSVSLKVISVSGNAGTGADLRAARGISVEQSTFINNGQGGVSIQSNDQGNDVSFLDVLVRDNGHYGISIDSNDSVEMENVSAFGNSHTSASHNAVTVINDGSVSIKNSSFSENLHGGLAIESYGTVMLSGVTISGNAHLGAYIDNCRTSLNSCRSSAPVTISGKSLNEFSNNGNTGLTIYSGGKVSLSNFNADNNGYNGVEINNNYDNSSADVVISKGYNVSRNHIGSNQAQGIKIRSNGRINISYLEVEDNNLGSLSSEAAAYLNNRDAAKAKSVTIKYANFNGNNDTGLRIESLGSVKLYEVNANNNNGSGVIINNSGGGSVAIYASRKSTLDMSSNGGHGLHVLSSGKITVKYINAQDNDRGNYLENTAGTSASVFINSLNVSGAGSESGLIVLSNGVITLSSVTSSDSLGKGIVLDNDGASSAKSIKLSNVAVSNSSSTGLDIHSLGSVSLKNVSSSSNGEHGLILDNCRDFGGVCAGSGPVKIYGSANDFSNNAMDGAIIRTNGSVKLYNVNAHDNAGDGVNIDNSKSSGNVTIYASSKTIQDMNSNNGHGFYVISSGKITVKYVDAQNNNQGNRIENTTGISASVSVNSLNVSGTGSGEAGLMVYSNGAIRLSSVTSSGSLGRGIFLDNDSASSAKSITLSDVTVSGSADDGLTIFSLGTVSLKNISSSSNNGYGLSVDNCRESGGICTGSGSVKIYGNANDFSNNGPAGANIKTNGSVSISPANANSNGGDGIHIYSFGSVKLYKVNAHNNSEDGVEIDNSSGSGSVTIYTSRKNILDMSSNGGHGLHVLSSGKITIKYINAQDNDRGNYLENTAGTSASVFINSLNVSGAGSESGLIVLSNGVITLSSVTSSDSLGKGILLDNDGASSAKSIKLSNVTVSGSANDGLTIYSLGTVSLKNISSSSNNGLGLSVDNCRESGGVCTGSGSVKIYGSANDFSNNTSGYGAIILTGGSVTMTNITADGNGNIGLRIDQTKSTGTPSVKLTSSKRFTNSISNNATVNGYNGIEIETPGSVSFVNLIANSNGQTGIYIRADGNVKYRNVSANDNGSNGMDVETSGTFIWSGGDADGNTNRGASINNINSPSNASVSITNVSFDANSRGLMIDSLGNVTLKYVSAHSNSNTGLYINNHHANGKISVTGTYGKDDFSGNGGSGLVAESGSSITLINVGASGNTSDGIHLRNNSTGASGDVVIKTSSRKYYSNVSSNGGYGINIESNRNIYLANIIADNNGSDGIAAKNDISTEVNAVTLNRLYLEGNGGSGAHILSRGKISASGTNASGNGSDGLYLNNQLGSEAQNVSLNSITAEWNGSNGVQVDTGGELNLRYAYLNGNSENGMQAFADLGASIYKMQAFANGTIDNDGDGLHLTVNTGETVNIKYSTFMTNYGDGIQIMGNTNPFLYKTYYTGNDLDDDGNKNLNLF